MEPDSGSKRYWCAWKKTVDAQVGKLSCVGKYGQKGRERRAEAGSPLVRHRVAVRNGGAGLISIAT